MPITTRTQFEFASCSKLFTATAVLLLNDRKMLSLEHKVRSILPELPEYRRENPILIRDLLSHTSGLPEYFDFEVVPTRNKSYVDNADYLPMFARLKETTRKSSRLVHVIATATATTCCLRLSSSGCRVIQGSASANFFCPSKAVSKSERVRKVIHRSGCFTSRSARHSRNKASA